IRFVRINDHALVGRECPAYLFNDIADAEVKSTVQSRSAECLPKVFVDSIFQSRAQRIGQKLEGVPGTEEFDRVDVVSSTAVDVGSLLIDAHRRMERRVSGAPERRQAVPLHQIHYG